MAADKNFGVRLTLGDANRVKLALEEKKERLQAIANDRSASGPTPKERQQATAEAIEYERILRISF